MGGTVPPPEERAVSTMSTAEAAFCRSAPWRAIARRIVLPWALDGAHLEGDALEVGGGSGAMAEALLHRHAGLRLTTTDVDPAMTAHARTRLDRFGDRARVEVADAADLPYPDGSFDVVVSFLMLHHVGDWEAALREVHRVLRPGGRLIGCDLVETRVATTIHRLDRAERRHHAADALGTTARSIGFDGVRTRPGWLGHLVRFRADRPHGP